MFPEVMAGAVMTSYHESRSCLEVCRCAGPVFTPRGAEAVPMMGEETVDWCLPVLWPKQASDRHLYSDLRALCQRAKQP